MTYEWLNKTQGNNRLILIFAGWGSDARLYEGIDIPGWDVLVCSDYDASGLNVSLLDPYDTIYLYAWSLGVHAASRELRNSRITAAFAINGTEWPCDDNRGIPVKIFTGTTATLSYDNLMRFRRRMFASKAHFLEVGEKLPKNPDIEKLKSQLQFVKSLSPIEVGADFWTRSYISSDDMIFPATAQLTAWENSGVEIVKLDGPHYLDLTKIIRSTIPNTALVGRKFQASLSTYDANAVAQRQIVEKLVSLLSQTDILKRPKVLEIGQGSGLSTQYFGQLLHPEVMDCVDLYPTPHYDLAPSMRYHEADAEQWINTAGETWDYIVSSSAIQWFSNIDLFFHKASRHLSTDGVLACATFLPGNLGEFDSMRPSPMLYHKIDFLEECASKYFERVEVMEDKIVITFSGAKEALRHLRLTGVGGSAKHDISMSRLLDAIPINEKGEAFLTYRPGYIIARVPKL